jgi:hypothetical protein
LLLLNHLSRRLTWDCLFRSIISRGLSLHRLVLQLDWSRSYLSWFNPWFLFDPFILSVKLLSGNRVCLSVLMDFNVTSLIRLLYLLFHRLIEPFLNLAVKCFCHFFILLILILEFI